MKDLVKTIINELDTTLNSINEKDADAFVKLVDEANEVFLLVQGVVVFKLRVLR